MDCQLTFDSAGMFAKLSTVMGALLRPTEPMDTIWGDYMQTCIEGLCKFLDAWQISACRIMQTEMVVVFMAFFPLFFNTISQQPNASRITAFSVSQLRKASQSYSYHRMHQLFMEKGFGDPFVHSAVGVPVALMSGDIDVWKETVESGTRNFLHTVEDIVNNPKEVQNHLYYGGVFGGATWKVLLKCADAARRCYRAAGISWATVDAIYEAAPAAVTGQWRPRNSPGAGHGAYMVTADGVTWSTKCSWIIACSEDELPAVDEFLDALLPPAQLAKMLMPNEFMNALANGIGGANPIVLTALACERYGPRCWKTALSYC
eukprot:SAG31_NODE_7781_length_1598_cov_1.136758_1_plen_317_part_10